MYNPSSVQSVQNIIIYATNSAILYFSLLNLRNVGAADSESTVVGIGSHDLILSYLIPNLIQYDHQQLEVLLNKMTALVDSNLPDLTLISKGKVRDVYSTSSPDHLLFVASDRISAYDVILKNVGLLSHPLQTDSNLNIYRVSQIRGNSLLKYHSFGLTNLIMSFQTIL